METTIGRYKVGLKTGIEIEIEIGIESGNGNENEDFVGIEVGLVEVLFDSYQEASPS